MVYYVNGSVETSGNGSKESPFKKIQIVGYFRGMVLIYQALVYLEPVTFELRILHRNHLASLGVPESLEYTFYV